MQYCDKCETECEDCMCRTYKRWCANGQRKRVPFEWKVDWSDDGYINDPEDCNHAGFEELMDGSGTCKDCGQFIEAVPDEN